MSIKDLVVKTGTYKDSDGNEKPRYENIGKMMEGQSGPYLILKRTFNPAGVPNPDNRDSLVVSIFDQREQGERTERPSQPSRQSSQANKPDDDIPF